MHIRDVKEKDRKTIFAMAEDFYSPDTGATLRGMNRENMSRTFSLCLKENPYARMLIMEEGEQAEGFCLLSFTWSNEVGGLTVLLEELYVRPEARGKGCGRQLLSWLEEEYTEARRFRLEATCQNRGAIALYEKQGYEVLDYIQMVKDR